MDNCIKPFGKQNEVSMDYDKTTPVSGISGEANQTLGEISLPLQAGGYAITYTADVIGGSGSTCPALVGNPTLRRLDASIFANWFANGDGLMMVGGREKDAGEKHYRIFRLLLTDSGHYILPTDYEQTARVAKETKKEIVLFSQKIAEESLKRWDDVHERVRHCFLSHNKPIAVLQPGGDRGEPNSTNVNDLNCVNNQSAISSEAGNFKVNDNGTAMASHPIIPQPDPAQQEPDSLQTRHDAQPFQLTTTAPTPDRQHAKRPDPLSNPSDLPPPQRNQHALRPVSVQTSPDLQLPESTEAQTAKIKAVKFILDEPNEVSQKPAILADQSSWIPKESHVHNDDIKKENNRDETSAILAAHVGDEEHFPKYQEDQLPDGVDVPKLNKRYRALPEEFYTKTGMAPITPKNFNKWFNRTRGKGLRWHFWEMFSGTGRLSLVMFMAGLIVGFPVDYRYGWNLADESHQAMLRKAQAEFRPGVVHLAPDCAPWSISSSSKDPELRLQERIAARPTLEFTQEVCEQQDKQSRGYNMEQPLGSALFQEELPENPLRLQGLPGYRKRQRLDQCMLGAQDEHGAPIQKATGFSSNFKWKRTAVRCSGHQGKAHAHLQGTDSSGLTRTSRAAAYPRTMCQRMKLDLIDFLHNHNLLRLGQWPEHLRHFSVQHFYECIRCQLGRFCPSDIPHTMVPRECRHGRWASGTGPKSKNKNQQPADPLALWKERANRENYETVKIHDNALPVLSQEQQHYLKRLLIEAVDMALEYIRAAIRSKIEYAHWVENSHHIALFKQIFAGHMMVRGVRIELRPFKLRDAEPQLVKESSHLRLLIRGHVKEWTICGIEDLRECSHNQIYGAIDEDDWLISIFGTELQGVPAPSTPMTRPRKIPALTGIKRREEEEALSQPSLRALPDGRDDEALLQSSYEPAEQEQRQEGEEEFEVQPHAPLAPLRPNYNLRKVLQRLPGLVERGENERAKRLLLGLHERLWHSPASDFTNLLRRAGMSGELISLAREAVKCCAICRKYVRLPNRPQLRAKGAHVFNETVQMDLFYWESTWFMLLIDEATRFKKCGIIEGQESEHLMKSLLELWIYHFGPPERLVLDQQVALMSHESGAEFERLNISRCPRGTTAGHGAEQHTGTGIVERHVQLIKLTMYKLRAELQRQGLQPTEAELGQEAAMAQNLTLSYGGVTPSMAVYGTLPREFYNPDSEHIMNTDGALETDLTVFERALRIRQTSLAQAQQAVIEDRVARASRTRPHQLEVGELVAGTSEVEFYREVKNDQGWRGPALLLRLDADEGVAIIQYQGKPYLVSLRHIRPFRGIYHVEIQTPQMDDALWKLMKYVENMSEYKVFLYGWIRKRNSTWVRLPKNNDEAINILAKADTVSKALTHRTLHGVLFGRALRAMKPPAGTIGTLLTWIHGGRSYAVQEHNTDNHLQMKKISNHNKEDICVLYFFYYINVSEEVMNPNVHPKKEAVESTTQPDTSGPMEEDPVSKKREGPETRTVVLSPEKKRQRIAFIQSEVEFMRHWYNASNRSLQVQLDFCEDWRTGYNLLTSAARNFLMQKYDVERKTNKLLFTIDYKISCQVNACLRTARIYKVDQETNTFDDHEISAEMWPEIDQADANEVKQFVDEKAFKPIHRMQLNDEMVVIDCKWVRKHKRHPDGSIKVKSRLCARGCFDAQKQLLTTRSTTATRLSQRLLVSQAARDKDNELESWDIAGAFLKGFDFKKIQECLKKLGLDAPTRQVVVFPPMNVWRHLQKFSDVFRVPQHALHDYGLLCLKPIYGLNDAPLAWQLCLHEYILDLGATKSKLDENCFLWKRSAKSMSLDNVEAMLTTHVDDLALTAPRKWLDEHYNKFVSKFKKVSRQSLPFSHCGCTYRQTKDGFSIDQEEFVQKMKPAPVPQRPDDSRLEPAEVSDYRSILGALLWVTATRLDLVADISVLQSRVTIATVKELKLANEALVKAKDCREAALHYRRFKTPHQRLVCIHDASSANNGRHYAQEGVLVLLADDMWRGQVMEHEVVHDIESEKQHGGVMHVLHAHGGKAKRVSYSTSHAETLSMVNGVESTTLVMVRLSEMMHTSLKPTLKELIDIQENGNPALPSDFYMDCRDLFELCTGQKVLPQDKTQRLYVLGIREGRLTGRIRQTSLIPTESMTADALTKPMQSPELLQLLTTGKVTIYGVDNQPVVSRILPSLQEYDEQTLMMNDDELLEHAKQNPKNVKATHATILFGIMGLSSSTTMQMAMMMGMATLASAADEMEVKESENKHIGLILHYGITFIVVIAAILVEKYVFQMHFVRKTMVYLLHYVTKTFAVKVKVEIDDPMDVDSEAAKDFAETKELKSEIEMLTQERDSALEYQLVLEQNRNMYKAEAEKANYDLATAEDKIQDLEDNIESKQQEINRTKSELSAALEQKQYHSTRVIQLGTAVKEKDARIKDLKEQLANAGNKMARHEEAEPEGGRPSSSAGDVGPSDNDARVVREALDEAIAENTKLKAENIELKGTVKEKKEVIQRMDAVYQEQQQQIRDARFPNEIHVTPGGAKYHLHWCRHLQRAKKDLPTTKYQRCFDCG